jgi:hypothetical protein
MIFLASLVVFGLINIAGHQGVRQARKDLLVHFESPKSRMPVDVIKIIAGEFRGLVADYLLLEVGSFLGGSNEAKEQDWQNIYLALKQSLALDPYFQQTYIYVQGNLPWQGKMVRETNELLEISRRNRPWDWLPGQYIGFNDYYFLGDYSKASEAFLQAAKIKGAPVLLADLGGRFALKSQQSAAAIAFLQDLLNDKTLDDYKRTEIENRITALKGVLLLEKALAVYRKEHNRYPSSLDILISEHILSQLPANPYAAHYFYDPETGGVKFDRVK